MCIRDRVKSVSADVLLTVTSVNEGNDQTPGDGTCATGLGECTLRAALEESNALPGTETIQFNIPGGGVHSISITVGPLPLITDTVILDGTSQPNCTVPCIVLSGASLAGNNVGLSVLSNGSIIRGFIITSWSVDGVLISGEGNKIQASAIGFWPGNPAALPNAYGVEIEGQLNKVGGYGAAVRNTISGNTYDGISISRSGSPASGNIIQGNFIGTDVSGTSALPNGRSGIVVYPAATDTLIGGSNANVRNVISGNTWRGIEIAALGTLVQGNYIGTTAAGNAPLGNSLGGIFIHGGSALIGGGATTRNIIAYNSGAGIAFYGATTQVTIKRNSIFQNSGLGIDIGFDGVTPNDTLDVDTGPNGFQNFPAVTSATSSTRLLKVSLRSKANQTYRLDFFSSPAGQCDASGFGEGRRWIGMATVTTNGNGAWNGNVTTSLNFPMGTVITATATDSGGATSEFSRCRVAL